MRAKARAQLTQHVYTFGIVRLPSLASLAVRRRRSLGGLAALRWRSLAGLPAGSLASWHGSRWQSYLPALAGPALAACLLACLLIASPWPLRRPFSALPSAFHNFVRLASFMASNRPSLGLGWLALLPYGGGLASALAGLPCWPIKIGRCLAGWLASALPFRRLAPWLALAGFVLPIKIGGGLAGLLRLAFQ